MSNIDYDKLPPECDQLCEFRECLHKGENKGTYVQGRGYVSYHKSPDYVCMTRMLHGCPMSDNVARKNSDGSRSLLRVEPDLDKMFAHYRERIGKAKCTSKVRVLMTEMLRAMMEMSNYVASEDVAQIGQEEKGG